MDLRRVRWVEEGRWIGVEWRIGSGVWLGYRYRLRWLVKAAILQRWLSPMPDCCVCIC
jgi:hypothetical protein